MHDKLLLKFALFSDLDEHNRLIASKLVRIETANQASVLFEIGDNDNEEFFLVDGDLQLTASDGRMKEISEHDNAARFPLSALRPRKFTATVQSEKARIIRIDVKILRQLQKLVPVAGDKYRAFSGLSNDSADVFNANNDVDEIKKFLSDARQSVVGNSLRIPNFSDSAKSILKAAQDPDVSLKKITHAIEIDLAMSAKIVRAANSAFYGGLAKVDSVQAATVRLGLDLSVQLVTLMAMKEVFRSNDATLSDAMHRLWQSSMRLASYAVAISKKTEIQLQQGQVMLAAMVSDIGLTVIIAYLNQHPAALQQLSEHVLTSSGLKKSLGKQLLQHWLFPKSVIDVVELGDNYEHEDTDSSLSDIVCLARFIVRMMAYRKLPYNNLMEVPAFRRLRLDVNDPNILSDINEQAQNFLELFSVNS